jgi:two-component system nitrogen regulation sensor histidine kinase NtrY
VASPELIVELAEPTPDVMLQADSRMIGQALTNVLKNASEAVEARRARTPRVKGRITARMTQADGAVAIEVEDNGVGLPAKDRDRLTEPYVTTREKGTGLGLAIVKRILEDHGGELELADARSGQGALAILRLPVAPAQRAESEAGVVSA